MTPKEKAEELFEKYKNPFNRKGCIPSSETMFNSTAKQCTLIAVDECINAATSFLSQEVSYQKSKEYWYNVKIEIEKL